MNLDRFQPPTDPPLQPAHEPEPELDDAVQCLCGAMRGYYRGVVEKCSQCGKAEVHAGDFGGYVMSYVNRIKSALRGTLYEVSNRTVLSMIESMRKRGYVVQLDNGLDGTWEASFYKPTFLGKNEIRSYGAGDTMEMAIAEAIKTVKP